MSATKLTVLLADDDSLLRELLKTILRNDGYEIVGEARNADETLELCSRLWPKLVLLDINMPGRSGLSALRTIKKNLPDTMVIMISGEPTRERVEEAQAQGAIGFIVKPVSAGQVLDEIAAAVSKAVPNKPPPE